LPAVRKVITYNSFKEKAAKSAQTIINLSAGKTPTRELACKFKDEIMQLTELYQELEELLSGEGTAEKKEVA
jgi:hypothetical protein